MGTFYAAVTLLCLYLLPVVTGHGMMCTPRQRGAYHSSKCGSNLPVPKNPVTDYCAHCLNGGTVAAVKNNLPSSGWKEFEPTKDFMETANRAGICGDPKGNNDHMIGGSFMPYSNVPIVEHWKTGSQVDFAAELDTNHNGYFEFYICNLDKCKSPDISGMCYERGHCKKLLRVPHRECENPSRKTIHECGPIDSKYPGRWYVPCRKTGHVGVHVVGGPSGTMRYKLPNDLECKHCVVQWYWATANYCAPRGFLEYFERYDNPFGTTCDSDGGGRGAHRKGMGKCGGAVVPEEFWSCSDVQISVNGDENGPVMANPAGSPDKPTKIPKKSGKNPEEKPQKPPKNQVETRKHAKQASSDKRQTKAKEPEVHC